MTRKILFGECLSVLICGSYSVTNGIRLIPTISALFFICNCHSCLCERIIANSKETKERQCKSNFHIQSVNNDRALNAILQKNIPYTIGELSFLSNIW